MFEANIELTHIELNSISFSESIFEHLNLSSLSDHEALKSSAIDCKTKWFHFIC